jgi:hypothetical protein
MPLRHKYLSQNPILEYPLPVSHSRTVHPDIIKSYIYPTECTTRLKFALKFYINFGTGVLHLIQINHQPGATIF